MQKKVRGRFIHQKNKQKTHGPDGSPEKQFQLHVKNTFVQSYDCTIRLNRRNKRPMGHIPHLRKQFKSINTWLYHNVDKEKKKNIINFMRIFCFFIWRNLNPLHPRMLCAKMAQWFWREGFFLNFFNFVIISPGKRAGPFIWTNLNPLHPRMHCAKFGWNWPSGSGEEDI